VVISVRVADEAQAADHQQRIAFAVQDTGIGIAAENQAKIFKGFSQAEASTSRRFGGTGLGLVISQRLVTLMGGTIQLSSSLGVGSTFSFELELPPAPGAATSPPQTPALKVLLVDDNPVSCALLASTMRALGWIVDTARGGHDAIALCQNQSAQSPYDVLFLDWQMHGLNGWDTLYRLRLIWREHQAQQPKVVMMSSTSKNNLTQRTPAEQDSLNAFITKPLTPGMLLDAVRQHEPGSRATTQPVRSSQRRLSGLRILVVEDNAINQQIAEELLSFEGALVSIAGDGQQGVNAVASAIVPFDVVLMDIQMPVMDGYAATQAIRSGLGLHTLPIVGLTANAMEEDRNACVAAGMNEHVGKPFDIAKLVALLQKLTGEAPPANLAP
jgi:CheY-like chemotaxis protein